MSCWRLALISRGCEPSKARSRVSYLRLRSGRFASSLPARLAAYSRVLISSARSMATALARVPGALSAGAPRPGATSGLVRPLLPSDTVVMAAGLTTSSSAVRPKVFTIMVWPEMSAPGAWPVLTVVTPKERT